MHQSHQSSAVEETAVTYKGPDPKMLTSARLRRSVRLGLDAVIKLWKLRAERVGDKADEIDLAYVMNEVLAVALQSELKPYLDEKSQLPTSESAWDEVLRRIEKQH